MKFDERVLDIIFYHHPAVLIELCRNIIGTGARFVSMENRAFFTSHPYSKG
jgi:hypothetical protein